MNWINSLKKTGRAAYRLWMDLSFVMSWIMTRVILIVLFYGMVTPVALLARVLGKRFLNMRARPDAKSYWVYRAESFRRRQEYERQF